MKGLLLLSIAVASAAIGQVVPVQDAPASLNLSSGAEVPVLDLFRTTMIETDEPALVLTYPTSKTKNDLCPEIEEVWTAFRPIVEREKVHIALIFQRSATGDGWTSIWRQAANGDWAKPRAGDKARTANGLGCVDLITRAKTAMAVVQLRLIFKPGGIADPHGRGFDERIIDKVVVIRELKRSPGFLGDSAMREACASFRAGEKWLSAASEEFVDYLVINKLPVGDFYGATIPGGLSLTPVTDGVIRNVERALQSEPPSH
jgi:hypothetical protein